jgi:putative hydrolase of the HAD superfamily
VNSARFRAIIFDIGRVLIRMNVSAATSGLAQDVTLSPEETWSALQKDPLWLDWQEGRVSPRDWHLHLAKRLGGKLSFEEFVQVWNRALDPQPIQDDAFLQRLSKRYRLAVLSNTDPLHVAHMEKTYKFLSYFPVRIYSCRVRASKPSPLIYKEALKACKVRSEEAIYIDDIEAFAQAAERLGMRGIVFKSPDQLQAELHQLGIVVN